MELGFRTLTQQVFCSLTCAPQARLDLDAWILLLHGTRQLQVGRLEAAGFAREKVHPPRPARIPVTGRGRSPVLNHNADPMARFGLPGRGRYGRRPCISAHCCQLPTAAASGCDATPRARDGAGPRVTSGRPLQAAATALWPCDQLEGLGWADRPRPPFLARVLGAPVLPHI